MRRGIGRGDKIAKGELGIANCGGGFMVDMASEIFMVDFVDSTS